MTGVSFMNTMPTRHTNDNPFKPLSAEEIYEQLTQSRACYERGEYKNFDDALDEIQAKYEL